MDVGLSTRNLFQRRKAANVIGMSVGQDNMADISGLLAQRVQGPQDGTYTARNSSVNQSATIGRIQEKGIDRADRNDIESIRNLCYLYSAHEDPAEEMRKLLPLPSLPDRRKRRVDQRPIRTKKPHHRECRRQEGLLPETASSAENTFALGLRRIDSAAIALCPSRGAPEDWASFPIAARTVRSVR
jgi:hypothetical protein